VTEQSLDFGGLTIAYDDTVLEPRPWTAGQSEWAAALAVGSPAGTLLELCCGAGQIGLLAVHREPRDLVMVDLSADACRLARRNVEAAAPRCRVEVRQGDLATVLDPQERFVGVLADPPWVPSADTGRFPEDPLTAIDGGAAGLDLAWRCLDVAAARLEPGGWVLLQLGDLRQVEAVEKKVADAGLGLTLVETRTYGDRGVVAHFRSTTGTPPSPPVEEALVRR
jgi:methylase of polypeptide subunit release factors